MGGGESGPMRVVLNRLYEWAPARDVYMRLNKSFRTMQDIKLFSGMTQRTLENDLKGKREILEWLVKKDIKDVNQVGKIISEYYLDPQSVLNRIRGKVVK
jgi:hypothetical protein